MLRFDADRPRLVLITSSHQFPLGAQRTITRRLELISWADANDAVFLEDDDDTKYRYDGPPLPTLAALIPTRSSTWEPCRRRSTPLRCGYLAEHVADLVEMKDMVADAVPWPV